MVPSKAGPASFSSFAVKRYQSSLANSTLVSIGQLAFLGVAWPRDGKPTRPRAAGGSVNQTGPRLLPREGARLYDAELKSERQNGNSG